MSDYWHPSRFPFGCPIITASILVIEYSRVKMKFDLISSPWLRSLYNMQASLLLGRLFYRSIHLGEQITLRLPTTSLQISLLSKFLQRCSMMTSWHGYTSTPMWHHCNDSCKHKKEHRSLEKSFIMSVEFVLNKDLICDCIRWPILRLVIFYQNTYRQ